MFGAAALAIGVGGIYIYIYIRLYSSDNSLGFGVNLVLLSALMVADGADVNNKLVAVSHKIMYKYTL